MSPAFSALLVRAEELTPGLMRVSLVSEALEGLRLRAGQTLTLVVAAASLRRTWRIAAFDAEELRIDLSAPTAGDPIALAWIRHADIGDRVNILDQPANCSCEGPKAQQKTFPTPVAAH